MGCGDINFLEGGFIKNSNIMGGDISHVTISSSVLRSSDIAALNSIDDASMKTIADALTALPPADLRRLAQALFAALALTPSADMPDTTERTSLPTLMYGDYRNGMLGAPDAWVELGDKLVPTYSKADGNTTGA